MIYLIGMGPGHFRHVTREAIEIVSTADRNIAFGRIGETARQVTRHVTTVNKLDELVRHLKHKGTIAVLASGDACFFGILDFLKRKTIQIDRIIPGVTSFQYMMSQLQLSWHDARFFSLHGRNHSFYDILDSALSVILTDTHNTPDLISKKLFELGGRGTISVGFDLSYETEKILQVEIGEPIPDVSKLATIVVEIDRPDAA